MVSANINATLEPELEMLFNKSTVFEFDGQKVGIVGYAHEALNTIAILGMSLFYSYTLHYWSTSQNYFLS